MYKYFQLANQINRKIFFDNHRQSDKQTETEERNIEQKTVPWYKKTTFNVKTLKVRDVSEITNNSFNNSGKQKNVTTIVE